MGTLTYKQEIWKRIRARVKLHVGRAITISITAPLIVNGIIYLIFFYSWGPDAANQQIIAFFCGTVGLELLLLSALLLIWRYEEFPEQIYEEQAKRIEQFWPKSLSILVRESSLSDRIENDGRRIHLAVFDVTNNDPTKKIVELEAEIDALHQSSLDPETGEPMTLPFFASQRARWADGNTRVALRPDETLSFCLAYLTTEDPLRISFGEGGFTSWLFDREAVYQLDIRFIGKLEGETEFRRYHSMQVVYANPSRHELAIGQRAKTLHHDIPSQLLSVIDAAEQGYWRDYSSPFFRQQEQKRKEAAHAQSQAKGE